MIFLRRSPPLILIVAVLLSSCSTLSRDKANSPIEAGIAITTNKKEDVDAAQKDAYERISWAKEFNLEGDFPEKYQRAFSSLNTADLAYDTMKYAASRELYLEVSAILSDDFKARAAECRDEKAKVELAMTKALEAHADTLAASRFKVAQDFYIKAKALKAADDLPNAIATCRTAKAAFEYSGEYARVITLRDSVQGCEVFKNYSKEFLQAEMKILVREAPLTQGAVKDYVLRISILQEIGKQYTLIAEQCRKLQEEKRTEAEQERLAAEKVAAEKAAEEKVAAEKAQADEALVCARDGIAWADGQRLEADNGEAYEKAKALLADAEAKYAAGDYVGATANANQMCEFFSERYREGVLAGRVRLAVEKAAAEKVAAEKVAREKAEQERLAMEREHQERLAREKAATEKVAAEKVAAEKAAAERVAAEKVAAEKALAYGALVCARDGMAWADEQRLEADNGETYEKAKALLAGAEAKYAAGDYAGATAEANQVCELFSERYREGVLAGRVRLAAEKVAREKAEQERLVREKEQQERLAREKAEPVKALVKTYPEYFSPDGDGVDDVLSFGILVPGEVGVKKWVLEVFEEYIVDPASKTYSVSKRSFRTWTGDGGPPGKISWDGKSEKNELVQSGTTYPFIFSYTDRQDRVTVTQGAIIIGIIAQKAGDTINIKLPSLVFRADKADFLDLDPRVVERNILLIGKLAESLKKYLGYTIKVEGHANSIGKIMGYSKTRIQEEERTQVVPLSIDRAEKLRAMLIEQGINPALISAVGYGSSRPVASFTDAANRWKNRRVEFTLTKKN